MTKNSIDIVITSVPYTDTLAPIMAPAMLKGQVIEAGYSCVAFDGNAYAVSYMNSNQEKLESLKNFFFFEKANGIEDDVFLIIDSFSIINMYYLCFSAQARLKIEIKSF